MGSRMPQTRSKGLLHCIAIITEKKPNEWETLVIKYQLTTRKHIYTNYTTKLFSVFRPASQNRRSYEMYGNLELKKL